VRRLALTLFITSTTLLSASERLTIGGEALYWKPAACSYEYARIDTLAAAPFADRISSIDPSFDPGFRLYAGYQRGDCSCQISYLYLQSHHTSSVSRGGAASLSILGLVATDYTRGEAHLTFDYQNVDVRVVRCLARKNRLSFSGSATARWIDIERKAKVRGTGANLVGAGTLIQISETQGGGLGIGLQAEAVLSCCTAFVGFDLMALVETARIRRFERVEIHGLVTKLKYGALTYPAPALDFQLGLSTSTMIGCLMLSAEVGFESQYYWNALRYARPAQVNRALQDEPVNCRDVGFIGPYVGIRGQF
jgi:Legionella pneumophila major outer membrane protein precursor